MPVVRPTTEAELRRRLIAALANDPSPVETHLGANDDMTFSVDLDGLAHVTVTTLPMYHDVLRGGPVRRWVGRRFFVEKQAVSDGE